MKSIWFKIIGVVFVLFATVYIGVNYVAPRVLLKISKTSRSSTSADYGMRFDPLIVVSEDSLDLHGEFVFPWHVDMDDPIPNHSLIVLHPIKTNAKYVMPFVKHFINLPLNFILLDSRGHGKSEGHIYTLGIREADDISRLIDDLTERFPDHSFGIYARGNTSSIALRAMERDKRIRYGVVENHYLEPKNELASLYYDDMLFSSDFVERNLLKEALQYLDVDQNALEIDYSKIDQSILLLSTDYNYDAMSSLHSDLGSENKILRLVKDNTFLRLGYGNEYSGLKSCIEEFLTLESERAREYVKERVFQPSE